jgi:phage baseplate assembly protein gpV
MSKVSEKRERQAQQQAKSSLARKLVTVVLIVAAFAAVAYLAMRQRGHRLDPFAQCLASKQARMYGAYWCPHCAEQKEMFATSFHYVLYVECGIPGSRDEAPVCKDAGIKHFPTWQFADGERQEGILSLQILGSKTGCGLP